MEKELILEKNNKFFDAYAKVINIENKTLEDLLKEHDKFSLLEHLRLNFLLDCSLPNKCDRIMVEENSYETVLSIDEIPEEAYQFLNFKKFVSNETRNNIRKAQKMRTEETQQKITLALRGKHRSEAVRKRMSETRKGRPAWNKGKACKEETKEKLRKANLGKKQSENTKEKRKQSIHKLKWWNNGVIQIRCAICPNGWLPGRLPNQLSKAAREKCSQIGKHWYTNGKVNTMAKTCPDGYWEGKCKKHCIENHESDSRN